MEIKKSAITAFEILFIAEKKRRKSFLSIRSATEMSVRSVYHVAISNFDVVIQNFFLNFAWIRLAFCLLHSVIILPRFHGDFLYSVFFLPRYPVAFCILSIAFCNFLAAIPCWLFCILSFAFCNYRASIPCLFSGFWILRSAGCVIEYISVFVSFP